MLASSHISGRLLADVVGVALVEIGARDPPLRPGGRDARVRARAERARRPAGVDAFWPAPSVRRSYVGAVSRWRLGALGARVLDAVAELSRSGSARRSASRGRASAARPARGLRAALGLGEEPEQQLDWSPRAARPGGRGRSRRASPARHRAATGGRGGRRRAGRAGRGCPRRTAPAAQAREPRVEAAAAERRLEVDVAGAREERVARARASGRCGGTRRPSGRRPRGRSRRGRRRCSGTGRRPSSGGSRGGACRARVAAGGRSDAGRA